MAISLIQIIVEVSGVLNNLSISSSVRNSTILGSALIRSIDVAESALIQFFSKYLRKLLRVII